VTPTITVTHNHTWPVHHAMVSSSELKIAIASKEVRPSSKAGVCLTCLPAVANLSPAKLSLAMKGVLYARVTTQLVLDARLI
jgi:hypothetical protein